MTRYNAVGVSELDLEMSCMEPDRLIPPGTLEPALEQFLAANMGNVFGKPQAVGGTQQIRVHHLTKKACEIVQGLRDSTSARLQQQNSKWTEAVENACSRFFSPSNLDKFLAAFWLFWYPNWPVFHRPTFAATKRSPKLIAAMALMGACLTSEKSDGEQAMTWLERVEEWVFSDAEFSDRHPFLYTANSYDELAQVRAQVDLLQASYLVVLMLLWEDSSMRQATRARRIRFPQIVSTSRGLHSFARSDMQPDFALASRYDAWNLFAIKEECVRSVLFVFLLDCAFIIFNNTTPRMIVRELQYDIVCPDDCFQAAEPETWLKCMGEWTETRPLGLTSISDLIEISLKEELSTEEWRALEQTNLLNLFAIASAFHNLIFHHHNGPESHVKSLRVSRGLRNWVRVWGDRDPIPFENDNPWPNMMKVGFMRYAREYWSLAVIFHNQHDYKMKLNLRGYEGNARQDKEEAGLLPVMDSSDMGPIHELVFRLQDVDLNEALM